MNLIKPILLLLLTALPTFARLGETKAECEARYGKPIRTTAKGKPVYLKGGLEIAILFWKDKAVYIYFAKAKPGAPDLDNPSDPDWEKREPLTEAEMDVLLKANGSSSKWEKVDSTVNDITWERPDTSAHAAYAEKSLFIRDLTAEEQMEKEAEQLEAAKLKDFGGLGETKAECDKHYGKPIKVDGDNVDYRKDDFLILVTFWNGKAASITFAKVKPESSRSPDSYELLSGSEQSVLLQANAAGSRWKEDEDEEIGCYAWDRADGKARAIYTITETYLIVAMNDFMIHQAKEKEKQETKDLDGF